MKMRWGRQFKVLAVQQWEGEVPDDWEQMDESDQDQYVCDNWKIIHDRDELLDDDELEYGPIDEGER